MFIRDLHRRCVGDELATVPLWPRPRMLTVQCARAGCAQLAWPNQRPEVWAWQAGLGPVSPVAVGGIATRVSSEVFLFSFGLIQIKSNQIKTN
jgi:hypothetical protein